MPALVLFIISMVITWMTPRTQGISFSLERPWVRALDDPSSDEVGGALVPIISIALFLLYVIITKSNAGWLVGQRPFILIYSGVAGSLFWGQNSSAECVSLTRGV